MNETDEKNLLRALVTFTELTLSLSAAVRGMYEGMELKETPNKTIARIHWHLGAFHNELDRKGKRDGDPSEMLAYIQYNLGNMFGYVNSFLPFDVDCNVCHKKVFYKDYPSAEFCNYCDQFFCLDCMMVHQEKGCPEYHG